ncbi:MAG TPA: AarF/UbiB family protein [Syntrophales bacterium]|nr:AarF/UbiB family protein [Syntrophales bacterium]HOL59325.1 AarF/UbiB family protein [Syntrophales bacterium]HPO35482.1 AarF/UbiB family protein [Syntrophales bacterium]
MNLLRHERAIGSRLREIAYVLIKYGFGDIVSRLKLGGYLALGLKLLTIKRTPLLKPLSRHERIRLACEELGPTFIKLGQILSTRPDLIPLELARELTRLQDTAAPFPGDDAKRIVEEDLGPPDSIFSSFEEIPIAAASIAQVHRARLVTGEEVAVKIQRPGIRKIIEEDISILYELAQLLERHIEEVAFFRPTQIIDEFARTIREELTFTIEAAHAERFRLMFEGRQDVYTPRIFRQLSTERLLTMEYVEGIKISEVEALKRGGYNRKLIADRGAEIILAQVFTHGFFHADPHPGNILVLKDHVICFLDFGMMGFLTEADKDVFMDALIAYTHRDSSTITQALLKMVDYEEGLDERRLERDLLSFMNIHLYKPLKLMRMADILRDVLNITYRHRLRLRPNYFFVLKALSQLESIGLDLDPDFDLFSRIQPYVEKLAQGKLRGRIGREITDAFFLLKSLPADLKEVIGLLNKGKLHFTIAQKGLEQTVQELNRATNRLVMALILGAIIISSSIILAVSGQSLLGSLGFAIAAMIGLGLLISIFRSGIF